MNLHSLAVAAVSVGCLFSIEQAHAGCGDTTAARIDWVESLTFEQGTVVREAKLHGTFAWEASPDGWATHPVGGKLTGFVHFACPAGNSQCTTTLAGFIGTAGKNQPIYFHGVYDKSPPMYLHAEGEVSIALSGPAWPDGPTLEGGALNAQLWPTVAAMPVNRKGTSAAAPVPSPGSPPARGCSSVGGLFALFALLPLLRRAPRRCSGN